MTLKAGGNVSDCNGDVCEQCTGNAVCGDGVSYGTSASSSYTCAAGLVGTGTSCTYGCDAATGLCADIVAANEAQKHLALNDTFTCIGTQSAALPAIKVDSGKALVFNTTTHTVTNNGANVAGVQWGTTSYTPTGSSTQTIVAHVQSVTLGDGATMTVTGNAALALLVDKDFSATGTATTATIITVAATKTTAGPGGSSTAAGGAGTAGKTQGGGGGAGHGVAGAAGGGGNNSTAGGGAAGSTYGIAAKTEVLEAGAAGGAGANAGIQSGAGGGGGGALQITACGTINLGANVIVNASGGGGGAGPQGGAVLNTAGGGGGGGSGGTIILEATTLTVAGELVSNGGGGGGGGSASVAGTPGQDWANGTPSATTPITTPATGGTTPNVTSGPGAGGVGAAGTTAPGTGANAASAIGGGGGGGATGIIYLNVPVGVAAATASASPNIKTSNICVTTKGASPATCTYN